MNILKKLAPSDYIVVAVSLVVFVFAFLLYQNISNSKDSLTPQEQFCKDHGREYLAEDGKDYCYEDLPSRTVKKEIDILNGEVYWAESSGFENVEVEINDNP